MMSRRDPYGPVLLSTSASSSATPSDADGLSHQPSAGPASWQPLPEFGARVLMILISMLIGVFGKASSTCSSVGVLEVVGGVAREAAGPSRSPCRGRGSP